MSWYHCISAEWNVASDDNDNDDKGEKKHSV